jgi:Aspartyl/Asparaginyl beta-hydroxylase
MNRSPSHIGNIEEFLQEVRKLQFELDGSGAKMAFKQSKTPGRWLAHCPMIALAMEEIAALREAPVLYVMVNIVPPGCVVPVHTDTLLPHPVFGERPRLERWHLPLKTNNFSTFGGEVDGAIHMEVGYWYGPVQYWENHAVWNHGSDDRIHLICDLDKQYELSVH